MLVDLLDSLGLGPTTLVVFASDNGASNEGGSAQYGYHDYAFFESSGPLRGFKRSVYDGGTRSPIIARWPGTLAAGAVSGFPWYFADFMPTALELAGRPDLVPSGADGISIAPLLTGTGDPADRAATASGCIYFEFCTMDAEGVARWGRSGRAGNYKAVSPSSEKGLELYDLLADPGEALDLAGALPEVLAALEACMDRQHVDSPTFPAGDRVCRPSCAR